MQWRPLGRAPLGSHVFYFSPCFPVPPRHGINDNDNKYDDRSHKGSPFTKQPQKCNANVISFSKPESLITYFYVIQN